MTYSGTSQTVRMKFLAPSRALRALAANARRRGVALSMFRDFKLRVTGVLRMLRKRRRDVVVSLT
jgi:hypothetical protein